jgi:hypothetical protein
MAWYVSTTLVYEYSMVVCTITFHWWIPTNQAHRCLRVTLDHLGPGWTTLDHGGWSRDRRRGIVCKCDSTRLWRATRVLDRRVEVDLLDWHLCAGGRGNTTQAVTGARRSSVSRSLTAAQQREQHACPALGMQCLESSLGHAPASAAACSAARWRAPPPRLRGRRSRA